MSELLQRIKTILHPLELVQAPERNGDPLAALMPFKTGLAKYALDQNNRIIGLNLAETGLTDGQWQEIARLPDLNEHLQALNLSGNLLTEFTFSPNHTVLKELNLARNKSLNTLHFEGVAPKLIRLDINECRVGELNLPPGFKALRYFELQKNGLTSIRLSACPSLEFLDLGRNKLQHFSLPAGFGALQYLYLNNNQLTGLDFETAPRRLSILHLRDNKLNALPEGLLSFSALQSLYLHGNAFQGNLSSVIPPGENDNAFKTVTDYLFAMRGGTIPNERVKIIIVGNGRVGKTSLFRRLKGEPLNPLEKPTHGIHLGTLDKSDLPDIETDKLNAKVWDFGGQEIFYATHQFFLTEDALYIFAWTAKENIEAYYERDKAESQGDEKWRKRRYWLENIRHHSKKSPLLMVQTHCDKRRSHPPEDYTKAPYHAECLDFCATDEDGGLVALKRRIIERMNKDIPHLGEDYPIAYDRVIGALENIREPKITRPIFDSLCRDAGIENEGEESLLKFLRTTGTVEWFDHIPTLKNTIFIDPNWLTRQVYRLIDKGLKNRRGRIDREWIQRVLPDYSPEEQTQLLELLLDFKLIFIAKEEGKDVFISPQYLPEALDPDAQRMLNKRKSKLPLAFVFRFPHFVPDNVMCNFLSEYGPYSDNYYWSNGILFSTREDTDCIVEFDEDRHSLSVFTSEDENGRALQAEVCRAFVELSKNANAEISRDGRLFVSWQKLTEAVEDESVKVRDVDGQTSVPLSDYMHFFQRDAQGFDKKMPSHTKPAVFFSYAWGLAGNGENLEDIVDRLYESLEADGHYSLQRDKKDIAYKKSIREYMKRLSRGQNIVVVLSRKYLESPNCMFELLEIYRKSNSDMEEFKAKIFPVVLSDAKIYKPEERGEIILHWKNESEKLEGLISKLGLTYARGLYEDFEIRQEIALNIGVLIRIISDMNNLSPQTLSADNFDIVKKAIAARVKEMEASIIPFSDGTPGKSEQLDRIEKILGAVAEDTAYIRLLGMNQMEFLERLYQNDQAANFLLSKIQQGIDDLPLPAKMAAGNPIQDKLERFIHAPDVKTKIKVGLNLVLFTLETELQWDVKKVFGEILRDIKNRYFLSKP